MTPLADLDFLWPAKECYAYGHLGAMNGSDSSQYTNFEKATYQTLNNSMLFAFYEDAWCSATSYSGSDTWRCDECRNTTSVDGGVISKSSTKLAGCNENSYKWLVSSPLHVSI